MTIARLTSRRPPSRMQRLLGYDGPVATMLLATFQYFTVSVSFVACLAPVLAFQALVGWQPTHLAIGLGALSLLPVFPAVHGLLLAAEVLRAEGASGRAGRRFWAGFASAFRTMTWAAVGVVVAALLIGYDLALFGHEDIVFLMAVGTAAVAVILAIAISSVALRERVSPIALLTAAVGGIARRPHVALAWLLLVSLAGAATMLPVVGAVAWVFAPAAAAVAVRICNRALGFDRVVATR
ncbi:hypothetical protein [Microbacterium sp. NPDC056569]|uniref:hypothetical protein n=1 Tax=Microbacterium sp. NPDC056569 TaxID=3345867 RepID=UPI003673487C